MPPSSVPLRYDSRYAPSVNEKHRPGHAGWSIDMRAISAHGNPHSISDGKFSSKRRTSLAGINLGGIKTFIQHNWRSWTMQTSRPLPSPRQSITTAIPSSSTVSFIFLCLLWYSASALANNTGKMILMQFRYPLTLTVLQFGFVILYSLLFMSPLIRFSVFRPPTRTIINTTLPMGIFQVIGHVFASVAISRIPVSTVHTIKALSPLFTVAAYALFYSVHYSSKTYVSLFPLTVGVMLACSFDISASNLIGVLAAFGSAIVFVTQNIFFKKVMPSNNGGSTHRLDKINLLLYSSSLAFFLTLPLWFYYEGPLLFNATTHPEHITHPNSGHDTPHSVAYYVFLNGAVHFAQNIIAFVILGKTSPVTYSIASLIKRVAVICIAIVWFSQSVHPVQAFGIVLTFAGLYLYNNAKSDVDKGEKKMRRVVADKALVLPITISDSRVQNVLEPASDSGVAGTTGYGTNSASAYSRGVSSMVPHALHQPYHIPPHLSSQKRHPPTSPFPIAKQPPVKNIRITSPVDSYPSPPDSPPSEAIPLTENIRLGVVNPDQLSSAISVL